MHTLVPMRRRHIALGLHRCRGSRRGAHLGDVVRRVQCAHNGAVEADGADGADKGVPG